MADKRKRKTEYVVSGGVDTSLTKDQPDEDEQETKKEPEKQSKNENKEPVEKTSQEIVPPPPEKPKEMSSDLGGGDFLKTQGSENPFDVKISNYKIDPKLIKVDQFYPSLEHQFNKSNTKFLEEQDNRVEKAMKEIVEESSTFTYDETSTSGMEDTQNSMALVKAPEKVEEEKQPDDNNSAKQQAASSVFATAVDEQTLDDAKRRQQTLFQPESWEPVSKYSPGMQEIIDARANEHFDKAMELKEKKDFTGTINFINKSLALRDLHIYYVERAEAYIQLCDFQSAILNYKRVCLMEPENDDYYKRLAFLFYFQGQTLFDQRLYPEALEAFARAAEMAPDNVGYHIRSMTCLAALHRHGECLALVNKRLESENDNPDLYIMRARLHEMFRNTTLCYYDVKDAMKLNEDHPEAKAMMIKLEKRALENKHHAMQLNLLGKHREALQKISVAIETDPAVADFHVLRGTLHRRLADFNAAIDDFLLALDKCDHNEESPVYIESQRQLLLTYNDFAVECFTKGFYDEAIILLNKAIKGEKREKGLYINRGDCFFRQGDYNFALQDYHQALDLDPMDSNVKNRVSVIYNEYATAAYQDKNYPEAESKFTLALQYNIKMGSYYISRSRTRYMMENMQGARQDLIMGLLLDPTNEEVLSILSRLFPGKSVGDVVNSRAADQAKTILRGILYPKVLVPKSSTSVASSADVVETTKDPGLMSASAKSTWSQEDADISNVEERMYKSGSCFPNLKACMDERDFNLKLAEEKKQVHEDVKTVMIERRTLKYSGGRVCPLPPPSAKPMYGGRAFKRKSRLAEESANKGSSTNWRQFTQGIPVVDA